jgi:hypothetical protein
MLDTDTINSVSSGLTNIINLMATFVDSVDGGGNLLLNLAGIATSVFSK